MPIHSWGIFEDDLNDLCPQYVRPGHHHNMHTYSKPSINLCPPITEDARNRIAHT